MWAIGSIIKEDLPKISFSIEKEIYKFYNEIGETLNVTFVKNDSKFSSIEFNYIFEQTDYFKNKKIINRLVEKHKIK